jgi:ribosomal protein S18 acetylase RimI-like enzyme
MEPQRLQLSLKPGAETGEFPRTSSPGESDVHPVAAMRDPARDPAPSDVVRRPARDVFALPPSHDTLLDGVRRARVDDATVVAGLQVLARSQAFERGLLPEPTEHDFDKLVDTWQARLHEHAEGRTFLALKAREPVGFISAGPRRYSSEPEGEIYSFHVHPRLWRTRVQQNLIVASLDYLAQRRFPGVIMWVTVTNTFVINELTRNGFKMVERRFNPHHGQPDQGFARHL